MNNVFLVGSALLLVFLNGFFVAVEFSLVKLRQTRLKAIEKNYGWRGRILVKVHGQLDTYLSACQLGITLASLGLGWIGEPAFAGLLTPLFDKLQFAAISPELLHSIAFAFAFSMISFLHIVVGEQAPKSLAIRNPEGIGLWSAGPLYAFYWLMYPAIWFLNSSANLVLRLAGLSSAHGHDTHYSAEELKLILRSSRPNERFSGEEWNILAKTLDFGKLEVSELMRPIHEITALYRDQTLSENLHTVFSSRFSRYPYFDSNKTDVLGVIHLKDLFFAQQQNQSIENLDDFLRPIQYIPAHMPAMELFRMFTQGSPHFAVIGQQGHKPRGFITLDNLLSAVVGEIRDEFCPGRSTWQRQEDGSLLGKGSLPIFSLERILGIDIENEELELDDVDSVGGLILAKLRDIPEENETVSFDTFDIIVNKMNGPRIEWVSVYPKQPKVSSAT
ncbi:MAG: hemolysin family protein [Methylomonas sp.]